MAAAYERLTNCYESIKGKVPFIPQIALVLGSGLGDYADGLNAEAVIDYGDIENFPVSTVSGHAGRYVFAHINGVPVVIMQGRVHYYEGYSMEDVVLPIRMMKMMGAKILFLTNAAGGISYNFNGGDLMMITGQISTFVPSPLTGPNDDDMGPRFPDMTEIYDNNLQGIIRESADKLGIPLQEGVYLQTTGPAYESPEEVRMFRILGADAVGMSTACEAVAAHAMGMKICGISCITNKASGMADGPLNHEDVEAAADKISDTFAKLVTDCITRMGGGMQG